MALPDLTKEEYNKYTHLPDLSINITNYLINNNDTIWNLLYYTDSWAWTNTIAHPHANLTKQQKMDMVYAGQPDETNYNVFFSRGQPNARVQATSILKIYPGIVTPSNYIYGNVLIGFEVYTDYRILTLSNFKDRSLVIAQQIIEELNGEDDLGGLGRLYFDRRGSRCEIRTIGTTPYSGYSVIMANWMTS